MSRLYQALKEARSFREAGEGAKGVDVWEALGVPAGEGATGSVAGAEPQQAAPREETTEEAALQESDALTHRAETPATEPFKNAVNVLLDRKARLLPNATDSLVVERYRMLRTKIMQEREKRPFRSLVITSANPQEGKTVTALNLAMSFSMLPSFRVLVVDGDMRRGTLGDWLGVAGNPPGLSDLIEGSARLEEVVLQSDDLPFHFIVRGKSQVADLDAEQFKTHVRRLVEKFDLVLVDSPPVNLVTDVQLWAASCDAVMVVARAFHTSHKAVEEAVRNLQPFTVIGAVLNAATASKPSRYHGYY